MVLPQRTIADDATDRTPISASARCRSTTSRRWSTTCSTRSRGRYDLMNDLMSGGLHRPGRTRWSPRSTRRRRTRPFALLDVAGGTGDIAFRIVEAGGAGTRATVPTSTPTCSRSAASAPTKRGLDDNVDFVEANAEELPFADESFDAYTIAFGIRNVPRIEAALAEAHRVLKPGGRFLCLEFSEVDVPVLDRALRALFVQRHPGDRPRGDRRRRALSLSGRIRSASFPSQQRFAAMMRARRLRAASSYRAYDRRHRGAAFRLEALTRCRDRRVAVSPGSPAPASCSRAKACSALVDPAPAARPARSSAGARAADRAAEPRAAPQRPARRRADAARAAYVKLGQFLATRPDVVGIDDRARSGTAAGPAWRRSRRPRPKPRSRRSLGRPLGELFDAFGDAGRRRLDRAGASRRGRDGRRPQAGRGQGAPARHRAPLPRDLDSFHLRGAHCSERFSAEARRLRPVEVVETLRRSVTIEMDLRLEAAALSEMAENTKDDPDFRVPAVDWDRTGSDVLTLEWIDGTPLPDRAALEARGLDLQGARRARDPVLPAPRAARRLLPRRHASRAICSSTPTARIVAVDFGIMGRLGPKERRFLAEILYGFITRDYRRIAEVHFEAGYVPPHALGRRASRRRSAPSASRSTASPPTTSRWRSC